MLGDCRDFQIKEGQDVSFKLRAEYSNEFCPKFLLIKLKNGTIFESGLLNHWHGPNNNRDSFPLKKHNNTA